MIDISLIGDIKDDVREICKRKYKNGFFDFSGKWKEEFARVWKEEGRSYNSIQEWIKKEKDEKRTT